MAEFIQTAELSGTLIPNGAGDIIRKEQYGIDATISGYIIQNVSVNKVRVYDTTYDQKNAEVSELDLDEQWTATMTLIGGDGNEDATIPGLSVGMTDFEWNGKKWKVRNCTYNGTYNDKKTYSLELFRCTNFPQQS